VIYGYIVKSFGYDAPFVPMIALLIISALLWFGINPAQHVISEGDATGETADALVDCI